VKSFAGCYIRCIVPAAAAAAAVTLEYSGCKDTQTSADACIGGKNAFCNHSPFFILYIFLSFFFLLS
jgi:hypothetical protein